MAEGADGEEEIQFLRTVSDAVAPSAVIKLTQSTRKVSRLLCITLSRCERR